MSTPPQPSLDLLPHSYPFILIDRIIEFDRGRRIVCLKNVSADEPCYHGCCGAPAAFPGVFIIEAMAQTSGLLIAAEKTRTAYLTMVRDAEFHSSVLPGDQLMIESSLSQVYQPFHIFEVRGSVGDSLVSSAEITLSTG